MSELVVSIFRVAFLVALWWLVWRVVVVVRRDLLAPRDAKPLTPARSIRLPNQRPALRTRKAAKHLIITDGPLQGTMIPLGTSPIVIGRAVDATVVLEDDFVSNYHTRVFPHDGYWLVEDMGSTNGTWIDREKVIAPTALTPNAHLKIGRTTLELANE